jgi:flagellar basal body-associated protein FliL
MKQIYIVALASIALLISACSIVKPFHVFKTESKERSKNPENATEYICENNQHFFVRMLNKGADAWLIFPDHEVNLAQSSTDKNRYVSGAISLVLNGEQTTLTDGDVLSYTGCKAQQLK